MENVIIIGTGPAGYTAGIYCARAGLEPTIISGKLPGGLLTQTSDIENFPGFTNGVDGFELMLTMQKQAEKFGAKIIYDTVEAVNFTNEKKTVKLEGGATLETKSVIIATGSNPRWLGLDAEKRLAAKGVSACATCDGAFFKNVPVVVVGGGDSAMEEASFLTRFASKVTLIHRRDEFRASKIMIERVKANPKIELALNSEVVDIVGKDEVESVIIKNKITNVTTKVEAKGYFAALGHKPSTDIFKGVLDLDESGYLILNANGSETNVKGVFGAGDCADKHYRQAITAAGMGCKAAIDAEKYLSSQE